MASIKPRKKNKRVVITGIGVISPNGIGKEGFWQANLKGTSGIDYIDNFDTEPNATKIGGVVKDFSPNQYLKPDTIRRLDRFSQFALAAASMAIEDARIPLKTINKDNTGTYVGSGIGGILFHEEQIAQILQDRTTRPDPLAIVKIMPNSPSSNISIEFGIKGPALTVSTACSSGLQAIGEAFNLIRWGNMETMIAGGTEAPLTYFTFSAFNSLRVMTQRNDPPDKASCPFDKRRDGFVLAEGAGFVILERLETALARNADIYAEIIGFSSNSSSYHIVSPQPDGADVANAIWLALKDADIKNKDIDYINAHGTSTPLNDAIETIAIKRVFQEHAYKLLISSTKSMIGHPIGAAGPIGLITATLAMKNNTVPPTINYKERDPLCDLNYVPNIALSKKIEAAMVNSFGFGGSNAVMIIKKFS